jgi:hypothetical protein
VRGPIGAERRNCKRHRHPVIAARVSPSPGRRAIAADRVAVGGFFRVDAQAAEAGYQRRNPIAFLDAQLACATDCDPSSVSGERGNCGQLVDECRHFLRSDVDRAQSIAFHDDRPRWLARAGSRLFRLNLDPRTETREDIDERSSRRIEPDVFDLDPRPRQRGGRNHPKSGRGKVARHLESLSADGPALLHPHGLAVDANIEAERGEGSLRVIAGWHPLRHRGFAFRVQAGEENGALDLGARHGRPEIDAMKSTTLDSERGMPLGRVDARAHLSQRRDHASHGPTRKRGVANEPGRKGLCSQYARQHPHGGAGVAGIEVTHRRTKLPKASSVYSNRSPGGTNVDAQIGQTRESRRTVCARGEIRDLRGSGGQRGDERVAV